MRRSVVRSAVVCAALAAIIASAPAASAASVSIFDSFSRKISGSWGSAPGGGPWTMTLTSGVAPKLGVHGSKATAETSTNDSKSIHLVGPSSSADVSVAATFTVNYQPATGRTNHWQVIARQTDIRTYYLMKLVPRQGAPASIEVQRARAGVFTTLATVSATFTATTGTAYRIIGHVATAGGATTVRVRAFAVSSVDPGVWALSVVDAGAEQLTTGRAGVRLSFYAGPARMTVDNVQITFA